MASTYSSNLKIELIGTGEQSGAWGATTNANLGTALEEAIVGLGAVSFASDADLTISLTNSNASQAARCFVLNVTSAVSLTATRNLIVPTTTKPYLIHNNTTGGRSIVVKTSAGTGITVPNAGKVFVYTDGTNVIAAENHLPTLTLDTDLAVADGGTGASDAATARTNLGAQATLVSGTNIKTINSTSLLGSGDIVTGDVTLNAAQTLTNKTIEAGTFTNGYTEETVTANTSAAYTINLANGTVQILTLTGNCTYTFPAAVAGTSFLLVQKQDATGSRTVTWPTAVKWPASTAPTITSTASKADVFAFTCDGTNWFGRVIGQNYL